MSKTSQIAISLSVSGDSMTLAFTSPIQENTASPGEQQPVVLSSGDNTITVPTGASGVLIQPAATSTVSKRIKGNAADVGFPISPSASAYLPIPSGATSFVLNASGAETISIYWP